MPLPCQKPRYAYKNDVRLAFCKNKVVEAVPKKVILKENELGRKLFKDKNNEYYYNLKGKRVYVRL